MAKADNYRPWDKSEREAWQKRMDKIEGKREATKNSATFLGDKIKLSISLPSDVKNEFDEKLKKDNLKPTDIFVHGISMYLNDELRINKHQAVILRMNNKSEKDTKTVCFQCYESMKEAFETKLKKEKLKKNDVLKTIVYQYINGELRVNKTK